MIYEPENLKNKRAIYEKRDKWLIRLAFLFWAVLLFIYVNIVIPYVKSTIGFLGIIVGGIAVITIVYFFTVFFVLMRRGRQFRKMNNDIVREYHENKNGELFLEKLLAIDTKPKDMKDEMTWYLNIATAFNVLGNPLVFDTFDKAVATNPGATPLLHSDRGYQYTSKAFRRRILAAGMTQSMSRVARCIDNGPMEGFWGLMKREMYYGKKYKTKEELMLAIEKYIDYYTNKRVQRNLGVLTPLEFHEQKLENVA